MEAQMRWLDDPEVFRVNQMPAHSDHLWFGSEEELEAAAGFDNPGESRYISSCFQSLNGNWKFHFSKNVMDRPVDFYKEDYDDSGWDEIVVPGHIEMAGYDQLRYVNIQYPWEGLEYRRPPKTPPAKGQREGIFSEAAYNPVGSYRLTFDLDEKMCGKDISLYFEGVEQSVYVWLNGEFIGYAEDTFTPSEFDLTDAVRPEKNVLAVQVHKQCTAAFLEDQDFFRFFGIFRDVSLCARPQIHIEDLWIRPKYVEKEDGYQGSVDLRLRFSGRREGIRVAVKLTDPEGAVCLTEELSGEIPESGDWKFELEQPVKLWEHKSPDLYHMEIRIFDAEGGLVEIVPYDVGFRKIEIVDKVMQLNGRRLILCGVNRHEWSAKGGRCIGKKERDWDMACIKRNHINAVRTCHYPDQIPWYYLCDKEGIYMIAETNIETHGSWGKLNCLDESWALPGSVPAWEAMALDRAKTQFEVLKNHTAILFWSLANESYAGETFVKMHNFYKNSDPDRLVHYEGVFFCPKYKDRISEIESRMYAYPDAIREYLEKEADKPFIVCEYMHDMGNSMGGLNTYMKLLEEYPMYQGGFIWDFIDQALEVTDLVTGQKVLRYGGDFDERPTDYEFSGNGIVFANRQEKPAMQEVRYQYGKYE